MGSGSSALAYGFCGSVAVAATARAVCQLQKSRGHETDQWHHEGFRNGLDHARVLMQDAEGSALCFDSVASCSLFSLRFRV
jgi:hypothetical protein